MADQHGPLVIGIKGHLVIFAVSCKTIRGPPAIMSSSPKNLADSGIHIVVKYESVANAGSRHRQLSGANLVGAPYFVWRQIGILSANIVFRLSVR